MTMTISINYFFGLFERKQMQAFWVKTYSAFFPPSPRADDHHDRQLQFRVGADGREEGLGEGREHLVHSDDNGCRYRLAHHKDHHVR